MSESVILALGSNLGNRSEFLRQAIDAIQEVSISSVLCSSVYETDPMGSLPQKKYLNQCVQFDSTFSPQRLLDFCKRTEFKMGRKPRPRWTSREIDIDVLTYGQKIVQTQSLQIPHPELIHRLFVLKPLCDLAPTLVLPNQTKMVKELLHHFFPEHHYLMSYRFEAQEYVPAS